MNKRNETRLKSCDIRSCQGMCCYDGAYLLEGEEQLIKAVVEAYPDDFEGVGKDFIADGYWQGEYYGRKTEVRLFEYDAEDFPRHFEHTRCVFADPVGYCKLEKLARRLGIHKWTFKPSVCWLFPLRISEQGLVPPPREHSQDPERVDETYPGFTTYARCGKHQSDGAPWEKVLSEELNYFEQAGSLPEWSLENATLSEIIEMAKMR